MSPYLVFKFNMANFQTSAPFKSEHAAGLLSADPGGSVWRRKQGRPSRGKNLGQAYHPPILSQGKRWSSGNELLVMRVARYQSHESH